MDKSSISTTSSTISNQNVSKFVTIPIEGNLQQSLGFMSEQQIMYNILELNLASMYNQQILNKMYDWSKHTKFYLKNRYILQKLINCQPKITNSKQKSVTQIVQKYDTVYVNGAEYTSNAKDKQIIKCGLRKQLRAHYISGRQQFSAILDDLSIKLKEKSKILSPEELKDYFLVQLRKINGCQIHSKVSPNKLQLIKSSSSISSSESDIQAQQISSDDSPKKDKKTIFSICFKNQIHEVKQISIQKCAFLHTKNRCPLILDFGFSRFIFKDDNQLSHQIVAMHLIQYLNKIISPNSNGKQQIIQYEIVPEAHGALYQLVENAMTVHDIKKKYPGGIPEYLNILQNEQSQNSNVNLSSIRKRFAQTYAGFCICQYLLDLKDRNNSNIMVKNDGSIFHIDLAFIFNATPGGINFQSAPFKFTKQYLNAMGGFQSDCFKYYQTLMMSNMTKLCLNRDQLLTKINIISSRKEQIMCFKKFKIQNYKSKIPSKPQKVKQMVEKIIGDSYDNWRTNQYDDYQFNNNKILR